MAQKQFIRNSFEKGMWLDSHYGYQPPGTYKTARNMVHETDQYRSSEGEGSFLAQEQSTTEVLNFPAELVGGKYVESRDWVIVLMANNEIGYVDLTNLEYKSIYTGSCFNFGNCEWIKPDFAFLKGCNDLSMVFSSNCILYKMNIDEMLRGVPYCSNCSRDGEEEEDEECCDHFKVMKGVNIPNITVDRYEGGGAGAPSGSYSFTVRCVDDSGNKSNWFTPSKPTALVGPNGRPGEPSEGTLKVNIKDLDKKFTRAEVAVIKNIGGVRTWHSLGSHSYNTQGITINFSGNLIDEIDIDPREIFVPSKKWLRARKVKIFHNKLHVYQVRQEKDFNVFEYSSKIIAECVAYAVNQEESKNFKSLERCERYRFGIVYNYLDGTHSAVGHIPAGGGVSMSKAEVKSWNQNNKYNFWEDSTSFKNVNEESPDIESVDTGRTSGRGEVRESPRRPPEVGEASDDTTGTAPYSPGDTSAGYSPSFSENKKPLENKDINNSSLGKDAYGTGVEIEDKSVAQRKASFEALAPDKFTKYCDCTDCAPEACFEAMELHEKQLQSILDNETNTALHTKNKIDPDPTKHPDIESVDQSSGSVKEAGSNIFTNAKNAKDKEYGARKLKITGKKSYAGIASTGANNESRDRSAQKDVGAPVEVARGKSKVWESSIDYPATKNCAGQNVYGGLACRPIRDHLMPCGDEVPIAVSAADGTISRYQMENMEQGDTHIILLGMDFSNITLPPSEKLPKPLNDTNPYSIVYVERGDANSSVLAKGMATGVFEGDVQGKPYLFGRHGVNSSEFIDRSVSSGPEQSRIGTGSNDDGFLFHSPTTDILKPTLDVSAVIKENDMFGSGNRLGLYAETSTHGKMVDPIIDNRGYRGSVNMNHLSPAGGRVPIKGITYAAGHKVMTPVGGLSMPLVNRYRERSVFVAASIGTPVDASFQGDTVDHYCPITNCKAQYVALVKDLPNQYGSVEGCVYIPLGLEAVNGGKGNVSGTCGDVFISFYTKRRTSYISDKNGNDLTPDADVYDALKKNLGMADFWKLPEDGNAEGEDVKDPKALAGTQGPARCNPGAANTSKYDVYLPSVAKTTVMFWCESRVHSDWREVGDPDLGEVWYGNLKTLEFDSDTPKQQDWRNCWMNRFYAEHIRPSQMQLLMRALVRFAVVFFSAKFVMDNNIESGLDVMTLPVKAGIMSIFMPLLQRVLLNNRMLNRMIGIREWYVDDSEGNLDEYIKQWEDVYSHYNMDYSEVSSGKVFFSMDEFFYDCDCDDCELGETTNEIFISNKQMQGSRIDNFSRFQANSYLDIPINSGKLQDLFEVQNRLFAHTTEAVLPLMPDPNGVETPGLGGQFYANPLSFSGGIPEGNYGTIDPNFSESTKWGHVFLDRDQRAIYLFNGRGFEEITAKGMKNFWKEFMDFCEGGCADQKNGIFFTMGVDHRHNRLLITKNVNGDTNQSFTLSYDLERGVWRSFHDYIPNVYFWNRRDMFSVKGTTLYKHGDNRGDYLNLHGKQRAAVVEFNAVFPNVFTYDNTILDTEANIAHGTYAWIYNQKVTFNKVLIYNKNQSTGWMNLLVQEGSDLDKPNFNDPSNTIMKWQDKEWRFNQVNDFVVDATKPIMTDSETCSPFLVLNESNIDQSKQATDGNFRHQVLTDKNITYKLVFDSPESRTHLLYFKQALTQAKLTTQ